MPPPRNQANSSPPQEQETSSATTIISPLIERSQNAFRRDLPRLLKEHPRQWVAYRGDEQVAIGPSKRQLYQECLRRGFLVGEFVVRSIEPEVPREVDELDEV